MSVIPPSANKFVPTLLVVTCAVAGMAIRWQTPQLTVKVKFCDILPTATLDYWKVHCVDIDECTLGTDNCQQMCSNTGGSFSCDCFDGYTLADDQTSCTGMEA